MPLVRALALASCSALVLAVAGRAQALRLDAAGGSMPGVLSMDVYPAVNPVDVVVVVPSTNRGPTPLSWIDPFDPRDLEVGIDLLSAIFLGVTGPDGHWRLDLPLQLAPSLNDTPLYLQALTLQVTPTLFDRVGNASVVWFAPSGAFRDRFVGSMGGRAFATVLPRTDGRWLLAGGGGGGLLSQIATDTTEIYDPFSDTFSNGPVLNAQRSLHTATELPDGRWLLVGGVGPNNDPQAACEIYDPATNTMTPTAPMLSPRMGHTATLLGNGKVLVTGGLVALTVTPTQLSAVRDATDLTELYDPATGTWAPGPLLRDPRAGHIAIPRPDGKVLLAGGISWDPVIVIGWLPTVRSSCDLYDPVANTIAAAPSMANARSMIDAVPLGNDRWLLAGGISSLTLINLGTPTATAEIYDAAANTWTTVGAMATARGNHKAWAIAPDRFLVTGGADGSILFPTPLATTEIFSTVTNTFSAGPPMHYARAGAAAYLSPIGQVHVLGGSTTGGQITNSTEWYFF